MLKKLIEFWLLDCASTTPQRICTSENEGFWIEGKNRICLERAHDSIIDVLDDLKLNNLVDVATMESDGNCGCLNEVTLKEAGGLRWGKFALPRWDDYVDVSVKPGTKFWLVSINPLSLKRRAADLVRYSSMSARVAARFVSTFESRVSSVFRPLTYWLPSRQLFQIDITEEDLEVEGNEIDRLENHLAWAKLMLLSQKWRQFGFDNRHSDCQLVSTEGQIDLVALRRAITFWS